MKGASNARVIWTIDLEFDAAGPREQITRLVGNGEVHERHTS